jgi:predicted RecA/RadA family phage recombinase
VATNRSLADGRYLKVVPTSPASPVSGDPVLVGTDLTGVAVTDLVGTTVQIDTEGVYSILVHADNAGASAVAIGDILYYTAANTPKVDKLTTGARFGYALEAIPGAGDEATIKVKLGY